MAYQNKSALGYETLNPAQLFLYCGTVDITQRYSPFHVVLK